MLIITIAILFAVIPMVLDIHSTIKNNTVPQIREKTDWMRKPDGTCSIPKLIISKIVFLGIALPISFYLFHETDAGYFAFMVLFITGVIHIPIVRNNYKLYKKFTQNRINGFYD